MHFRKRISERERWKFTSGLLSGHVVEELSGRVLGRPAEPQWEVVQGEQVLLVRGCQERPGRGTAPL